MNSAGNVRWRTRLARPAIALEIDPLGRYVIHGHSTGEIIRLDLFGPAPGRRAAATSRTADARRGRPDPVRSPAGAGADRSASPTGRSPAVQSEDQAETAVLAVTEDPPCVAVFTSPHRLQLYRRRRPEARPGAGHDGRRPDPADGPGLAGRGHRPPDRPLRPAAQHPDSGSTSAWSSSPTWRSSPTRSAWRWSRSATGSAG